MSKSNTILSIQAGSIVPVDLTHTENVKYLGQILISFLKQNIHSIDSETYF